MDLAFSIWHSDYNVINVSGNSTDSTAKRSNNKSTQPTPARTPTGDKSATSCTSEMSWLSEKIPQALRSQRKQVVSSSQGPLGIASARALLIGKSVVLTTYVEAQPFAQTGRQFTYLATETAERA